MNDLYIFLFVAQLLVLGLNFVSASKKTNEAATNLIGYLTVGIMTVLVLFLVLWGKNLLDVLLAASYLVWAISLSRLFRSTQSISYSKLSVLRDSSMFVVGLSLIITVQIANPAYSWSLLAYPLLAVSVLLFASVVLNIEKFSLRRTDVDMSKLPTVTLAIPARNETHALKQSLDLALASNYEKLEILVLDDCSQDKTAEMIRSYAHDGVRFIQGEEPNSSWLGKNLAYKTLLDQASGDLVLFCGVDVHLSIDSITQLVAEMRRKNLQMISVLPMRVNTDFISHILQPIRHFWLMALPTWLSKNPTTISSCWIADRQALLKSGGFKSVQSSMAPEMHIARRFNDASNYEFLISDHELDVTTMKRPNSQINTALRTSYPTLSRSFFISWLAALATAVFFIGPFVACIMATAQGINYVACGAAIILTVTNIMMLARISPAAVTSSLISFPIAMITQIGIIAASAWQYEFGTISWKGRNICIPAAVYKRED